MFDRVAFVGFGLIGSSLARIMIRDGLAGHISVTARTQATLDTVTRLELADSVTLDATEAVRDADLIMICTPLGAYGAVAKEIGPHLKDGAIVSDVGSAKQIVSREIVPHMPDGVHVVPGHPVAGTENSGPEAGFAELFMGRNCILTPDDGVAEQAIEKISALWKAAGMSVEMMSAHHHDQVLAITSHLPQLIAYTIVDTAEQLGEDLKHEVIKYSAGGFRDFTRIAASDPTMWRDIYLENSDALLDILGRFNEDLTHMRRAIRRGDGDTLHEVFTRTRAIRRGIIDAKQDKLEDQKT
ncbi:MAG: prephenate/arogenate dehydrogenase family protein [Rhodospirillales bacterium]|nr:prephenate/arogenate dehydrogenase family protein [Rhodospirillales bacterium]MBT4041031.1 prephenate/arogenate dehydrogenase family protein [Rhodospirillales bacterium]MBT4625280.1 prephenate/arogenate dehydrogenase family protein [Rhodospirillales bacterium]MBT5352553.1 prephenate/arogenate dehydrogenase family protein [Rhodospirillales bacterium]MBT5520808.1 prephenate/arogenate dehydrogenase family protein [Rhodospirillales bacterium]